MDNNIHRLRQAGEKAQAMSRMYERRIAAQKETINRLLQAREHGKTDPELVGDLCNERREMQDELLLHKATTQRIIDLLAAEEGALTINVDLIQAIINDGAEQERLRREAFHG